MEVLLYFYFIFIFNGNFLELTELKDSTKIIGIISSVIFSQGSKWQHRSGRAEFGFSNLTGLFNKPVLLTWHSKLMNVTEFQLVQEQVRLYILSELQYLLLMVSRISLVHFVKEAILKFYFRNYTCKAQPLATASSAFSVVLISLQKKLEICSFTAGILVAPPTISIL